MSPHLSHIQLFPVKSLDPCIVSRATILPSGALQHDRRFALVDRDGRYINGKRTSLIHGIRSRFDSDRNVLDLDIAGQRRSFDLSANRSALEAWLSEYFSMPVQLLEDIQHGFPDDRDAPGPTVISTATLETVASWFPGLTLDEVRLRFRANLEIGGVEPFWEDRLYAAKGEAVRFQIGEVVLEGVNPCQRCVVPTRSPWTGEVIDGFATNFGLRRRKLLPPWATVSRFDHYYRLAVNTRPGSRGRLIRLGDPVTIV